MNGPSRARRRSSRAAAIAALALLVPAAMTAPAAAATLEPSGPEASTRWEVLKPTNTGIPGDYVYSIAIDQKDRAWVTADDPIWDEGGIGQQRNEDKRVWRQWTNVDGKSPDHFMRSLQFDAQGKAWAASDTGLLALKGGKIRKVWSAENAPWPNSYVRDFDWDSRGNLWVALEQDPVAGGVARYNGRSWKVWTTANGLPWPDPWSGVSALEIDDEDRVRIGSPNFAAAVFEDGRWEALGEDSRGWVYDIAIASDGTPWFGLAAGGVFTWEDGDWVDRTGPFGYNGIGVIEVDREGRVWIANFTGSIWRWSGSGTTWDLHYQPPSLNEHIYALGFDSDNELYAGGIGGMAHRRDDGTWSVATTKTTGLPERWVDHVMVDHEGNGWFSTAGGGIGMYDGRRWTDFNPLNWGTAPWPFPTDGVSSVVEDADGTIWASPTNAGVGEWDGDEWTEHLPAQSIHKLTIDPTNGDVWAMPKYGEVQRYNGARWVGMDAPTAGAYYQIAAGPDGDIWLGSSIGLLHYEDGNWTTYSPGNSDIPSQQALSVAPEPDGAAVWVGTDLGIARFDGTDWEVFTEADGLPANPVRAIAHAPDGRVWVGAFEAQNWPYHGGLGVYDGDSWTTYTRENSPLPHNQVEALTVAPDGRVWIGTQSEGAAILTPR